jgi:hypothetical protein
MATMQRLKGEVRRAFAVKGSMHPLSAEDLALLERVAEAVVRRGMAVPATVFLDSLGPMSFLGGQALHFFTPILELVFPHHDVERIACLLERRDTLSRLGVLIERRAETPRADYS